MKKIIIFMLFLIAAVTVNAQNASYERQGNTLVAKHNKTARAKSEPTKTSLVWRDTKGNEYPVYMSNTGSCFIIKTSSKTGKEYRNYLGPEISQDICRELKVEYKGKKAKE